MGPSGAVPCRCLARRASDTWAPWTPGGVTGPATWDLPQTETQPTWWLSWGRSSKQVSISITSLVILHDCTVDWECGAISGVHFICMAKDNMQTCRHYIYNTSDISVMSYFFLSRVCLTCFKIIKDEVLLVGYFEEPPPTQASSVYRLCLRIQWHFRIRRSPCFSVENVTADR